MLESEGLEGPGAAMPYLKVALGPLEVMPDSLPP